MVQSQTIVTRLREFAALQPDKLAYRYLIDGEQESVELTYGQLDEKARAIAAVLQARGLSGQRALLLFPPGLDFVAAFFGCLYAGVTAVPAYPPKQNRNMLRLEVIAQDARAQAALTTAQILARVEPKLGETPLGQVQWIATDGIGGQEAGLWQEVRPELATLAFLQYTSGSTGHPKGVMVSHGNLMHNEAMIQEAFGQTADSLILGWLPLYHDMGLIGNVLQPLYLGTSCILMSPVDFLTKPLRWLQGISDYRATTSGGPNFAYDLCVQKISPEERAGLDLSSWTVAYNGAEPIRPETLDRFTAAFAGSGFRREAFYPCYGLAEGTLFVTGGPQREAPTVHSFDAEALRDHRGEEAGDETEETVQLVSSGTVWSGQSVRVVDPETRQVCPDGRVGEIWTQSPSVAGGYWNRPDATEETFAGRLADGAEGLFLRTGDLGFVRDGELYVTGRLKDLIIIRGRNHYPQDLEMAAASAHPALKLDAAAAFALEADGEEQLVIVAEVERSQWRKVNGEEVSAAVRRAIAEGHELQVQDVVLIKPGSIPKTSSGKIQRRACKQLYLDGDLDVIGGSKLSEDRPTVQAAAEGVAVTRDELLALAPEERTQRVRAYLVRLAADLLKVAASRVEPDLPLSSFGLDSLMAVEIKHRIESDLGVEVPAIDLLQDASVGLLSAQVAEQLERALPERETAVAGVDEETAPLSHGQQMMWFQQQLDSASTAYHVPVAVRVLSPLDADALERALNLWMERHPVLRTAYEEEDGVPVQRVLAGLTVSLERLDAADWTEEAVGKQLTAWAARPFALQQGRVMRAYLLTRSASDHVLMLNFHHVAVDLWSITVLMDELRELYPALAAGQEVAMPQAAMSYAAHVHRERERLQGQEGERQAAYWREQLRDAPDVLELPTDRPRPAEGTATGAVCRFRLGAEAARQVKALAKQEGLTLYMTLLAAYQAMLHRLTGQDDLLVGSPAACRERSALQRVVGYFVNPLPMRAAFAPGLTGRELLAQVKATALGALRHQDYPFSQLVETLGVQRDGNRHPLFQTMFVLQKPHRMSEMAEFVLGQPGARMEFAGLTLESMEVESGAAQFDLTLTLAEAGDELAGVFEYNTDLFDAATIERMTSQFAALLAGLAADPDCEVALLPLAPAAELERLARGQEAKAVFSHRGCVQELFEEQAMLRPEGTAVVAAGRSLTYGELNERANKLAHRLQRIGVGPDVFVGICMERSLEMAVAVYGVLKAGGAYVPLDPEYPQERLAFMMQDAQVPVLLTQEHLIGRVEAGDAEVLVIDRDWQEIAGESPERPVCTAGGEHLAYLIYTSGSTGQPKGVMIPHRAITNHAQWLRKEYGLSSKDRVLQLAPFGFDVSVFEIVGTLSAGGAVVMARPGGHMDSAYLVREVAEQNITILQTVPVLMQMMLEEPELAACTSLTTVIVGGEAMPATLPQRVAERLNVALYNNYGPTETCIDATFWRCDGTVGQGPVPIGRPMANAEIYVLDGKLQPVPAGVPGELYIGGAGLARGYLNRSELTEAAFVPHPFAAEPGARLYKTGDLVRLRPDGAVVYLGRIDQQVKIRGNRIELGEIETALTAHDRVIEAVVIAREDVPGEKRLVGYVVPQAGGELTSSELVRHLQGRVPAYMIPSAFVALEAIPMTANGKADRRALPAPDTERLAGGDDYAPPQSVAEQRVAAVFAEVLGVERVGREDNFFELGGHSLLAVQAAARLKRELQTEVGVRDLFQAQTVARLAERTAEMSSPVGAAAGSAPDVIDREAYRRPHPTEERSHDVYVLPASFAQQRMWVLDQLLTDRTVYNMPGAVRLTGDLDVKALEQSLAEIVRRQEVLRTTFAEVEGALMQIIDPTAGLAWTVQDLQSLPSQEREAAVNRLAREEAQCPFDLGTGPLFRVSLLKVDPSEHVLLLSMHHIVSDGWSIGVLVRELAALYPLYREGAGTTLPALTHQYADFALWQSRSGQANGWSGQLDFWKEQLAGDIPVLQLPTDRPRPAQATYRGGEVKRLLPPSLGQRLQQVSREEEATLYMTLLAAFQTLLSRYTGQTDLTVGSPVAGRDASEWESLIGLFVNTVVLRSDLSESGTFRELVRQVKGTALAAFAHQAVPFEKVVEEVVPHRDLSHTPLFQVMFVLQNAPMPPLELPGLTLTMLEGAAEAAKFDLTLSVEEREDGLFTSFAFNADLFDRATMERMAGHFAELLHAFAADPDLELDRVPLLTAAERIELDHANDTARAYRRVDALHLLFEEQAERTPDATAMVCAGQTWTYRELNEQANLMAHQLIASGVETGMLVGLLTERSPEMVSGMLAILKAGGAYVPLDPNLPLERLRQMAGDARLQAVLAQPQQAELAVQVAGTSARLLSLLLAEGVDPAAGTDNPQVAVSPEDTAYVLYTSGSTGVPKGVVIPHRAVINHMLWMQEEYPLTASDRVLQKTPFGFDASVWEFYAPLFVGAVLVVASPDAHRDSGLLVKELCEGEITILQMVPSMLSVLTEEPDAASCRHLRRVFCGGEALSPLLAERVYRLWQVEVVNLYGPTESCIDATSHRWLPQESGRSVPIGKPIANVEALVLDAARQAVPVGVVGDLYLGGAGLADGYLNRPDLTLERFVPHPFCEGARLYRTGDLARRLPSGLLEYVGRDDDQVKIRGLRIELGEIEAALRAHEQVKEALVTAQTDANGDKRVVAYVVPTERGGSDEKWTERLRAELTATLPDYMMPSAILPVAAFPLTPNGKVDRKALPKATFGEEASGEYVLPRTELEEVIADAFAEVLAVERVGAEGHFFALGGHSLSAVRVVSRLRQRLSSEQEITLRDLFQAQTVAELARLLSGRGVTVVGERSIISRLPRMDQSDAHPHLVQHEGELYLLPATFAQQRMWWLDQLQPGHAVYNMPAAIRLTGRLDTSLLESGLDKLIARHESLRTRFAQVEGELYQVIEERSACDLPVEMVSDEAHARRRAAEEAAVGFDLAKGPLLRTRLLRLGEEEHLLLVTMHHIISDGWSVSVLIRELAASYAGEETLPELEVQVADFAKWQRDLLAGETSARQLEYWKQTLSGPLPVLQLPTDRPRPAVPTHRGRAVQVKIPSASTDRLQAVAREEGATLYMALLAAFKTWLGRYSGQEELIVGSPVAGRERPELEELIGLFVNTVALRTDLSGDPTFRELLRRVRETAVGAFAHGDVPFEKVVEAVQPQRDPSRSPLFQALFVLQNVPTAAMELAGLTLHQLDIEADTAKFDLTLSLEETGDGLQGWLEYSTDLFDEETAERMTGHFTLLLEEIAAAPERRISEWPMIGEEERHLIEVEWSGVRRARTATQTIHAFFAEQAAQTPDRVAVEFGDDVLTYGELNEQADALARTLRRCGVQTGKRVGICLPRSTELIVSLLAVLKAGGAYVPLDPDYPVDRLSYMLEDSQATVLITSGDLDIAWPSLSGLLVLHLDQDAPEPAGLPMPEEEEEEPLVPDSLAYVMYTSGSTGLPKGVAVPHRGVVRLVKESDYAEFGADHTFLQFASVSFDAATFEIWGALLNGARLVLFPHRQASLQELGRVIREKAVTTLWLTAGLFHQMADGDLDDLRGVRQLLAGGDVLSAPHVKRVLEHLPSLTLINGYGPTENTTFTTCHPMTRPQEIGHAVPIGRPITGTYVRVFDRNGRSVPVGVPGELYAGGDGIALGYWQRPELTAERFVTDPVTPERGLLYRTGDLVRWLPNGRIEFLGRIDTQVKVRGYRIEPGEIEQALLALPHVRAACVIVREDVPGDKRLAAYFVTEETGDGTTAHWRRLLAERLPEYLVPSYLIRVEALPLTANGKVDRRALPAPDLTAGGAEYVAPRTETERQLASIWAELLGTERVGIHDNFFDLGGHSLLATQLLSRLRDVFQTDLPLQEVYRAMTVAELAERLERALANVSSQVAAAKAPAEAPIQRVEREGRRRTRPRQ